MRRLIGVEVSRALSRRLNRVVVVLILAITMLIAVVSFLTSRAEYDAEAAMTQAQAARQAEVSHCAQGKEGFSEDPRFASATPQQRQQFCEEMILPAEEFIQDKRFPFRETRNIPQASGVQLMLLALLIGASFIGAEWSNRTVTTMLTWESRRIRVFLAKALSIAFVLAFGALLVQALILAAFLPAGLFRGTMAGVGATWAKETVQGMLRVSALCGATGLLGMSLATVTRNTAGAAGAAFGYLLVFENVIRGFRPGWQTWLLGSNVVVTLSGEAQMFDANRTVLVAALIVGAYVVAVSVAAASFFRRADIG